ncbi:hypothetical protein LJ737_16455 [Hymenobacter sp. 15J16-1T3B]|uniref:hypothetical protein n=1 Tax=Hymenobacter sp. 15J16-1T3B TaxID=2886941 RepID=UPI001D108BD4|nr:hypothetical protein [Hymenobacter sp. 15J16-1T3B]MCC3158836.1 hypothetical protein [Hymenobacter sp. 15J16-1T3B]
MLGLLAQSATAQHLVHLRRAWRDSVDGVTVMPPYALDSTVTGLLVYDDYPHSKHKGKATKRGYWFKWPYFTVDGSLCLYITRRQLYLRTGHENPNPNMLHWVQDLTPAQFQAIDAALRQPKAPFRAVRGSDDQDYFRFMEFEPKAWPEPRLETDEQRKAFYAQEEQDLARRVVRLLRQLNQQLPAAAQLPVPAEKTLFARATHLAETVEELLTGGGVLISPDRRDAPLKHNFTVSGDANLMGAQQYRLDRDYRFEGYTEQKEKHSLTLRWRRKAGAGTWLPAQLTLQCTQVDALHITPAAAGQAAALDQQLWYAYLPTDEDDYELLLGLESGRTFHISCAGARLIATP